MTSSIRYFDVSGSTKEFLEKAVAVIAKGIARNEMLRKRADATREAILRMAAGDDGAPNLIDGGALQWDFGPIVRDS